MIINYWIITNDTLVANNQQQFQQGDSPVIETLVIPGATAATTVVLNQEKPPQFQDLFLKPPSFSLDSLYVFAEYGAQTPLRENLQLLEDQYDGDFIVAGCWDFHTGEPVGGVGSPWFVTQPELMSFMPNGVLEQRHVMFGQGTRKFV